MKKIFKTLMFVAVSAMTFHACSNVPDGPDEPKPDIPTGGKMIKLTISTGKPEAVDTRTMVADDGKTPMWCPGDAIGVSVFSDDSYTNQQFVNDNTETASEKTTFTGSTAVGDVVYTYYPYSSAGVTAQGEARLTIPAVQNPTPTSFDGAADLLVGKPAAITPSTTTIEGLQFKRVGGFLKIVLKDETGGTLADQKIGTLSVTAESNLSGSVYLDIVDGELGEIYAGESATVTANYTARTEYAVGDTDAAAYLGVYPQTLAAGTTLTVVAATQNCDIEKIVELSEDIEIKAGQITAITVNIGEDNVSEKKLDIEDAFPDPIFRAYVLENIDTDHDGKLSETEALAVTEIDIRNSYDDRDDESKCIKSLEGIQYFTNLTYLMCCYNKIAYLDVSKNTALTRLDCFSNQLTSLDVSKNTALTNLYCFSNQLTSLDVSKNTELTELWCYQNELTTLDVSKNTELKTLSCYSNQLTSLDVSKNTALTRLDCQSNQLTSLDVSKNTALTNLYCNLNQLTTLDVSKNTALTKLICRDNQLATLDVSKNTALTDLDCYSNQLTSLDVSKNMALEMLSCWDNKIEELDLSNTNLVNSEYNSDSSLYYPLFCAPMETLKIVYLKKGWSIRGITEDNGRSVDYIPAATKIVFLSGEYGDNGSAGGGLEGGSYEL